jgi:uncharacterized protein YqjF (DUF2071 family)
MTDDDQDNPEPTTPSAAILGVFTAFTAVLIAGATIMYAVTPDADKASLRELLSNQLGTVMLALPVIATMFGLKANTRQNRQIKRDLETVKDAADEQLDEARIAAVVNKVLDLRGLGHAPAVRLDAPTSPGVHRDGR